MTTTNKSLVVKVAAASGADQDEVRMIIGLYLSELGRALGQSRRVNVKHFGIFERDGNDVMFAPSPSLVHSLPRIEATEAVITSAAADVLEELRSRLPHRVVPACAE